MVTTHYNLIKGFIFYSLLRENMTGVAKCRNVNQYFSVYMDLNMRCMYTGCPKIPKNEIQDKFEVRKGWNSNMDNAT